MSACSPPGRAALVMVSGGQDSLTLLHLLATGGAAKVTAGTVHALHVNHHLRGDESDDDEALVVRACGLVGRGSDGGPPADREERAATCRRRRATPGGRRRWRRAAEQECDRIALGHTADDQVETMLYRLGRYGGLAAFAAMRPATRPGCGRCSGAAGRRRPRYCREHGLEFARDRGNAYPGYARTAIRETGRARLGGRRCPGRWRRPAGRPRWRPRCRSWWPTCSPEVAADRWCAPVPPTGSSGLRPGRDAECLSVSALLALDRAAAQAGAARRGWRGARGRRPRAPGCSPWSPCSACRAPRERSLGGGCRAVKEYDRLAGVRTGRPAARAAGRPPAPARRRRPCRCRCPVRSSGAATTVRAEQVDGFRVPDVGSEAFVDAGVAARAALR